MHQDRRRHFCRQSKKDHCPSGKSRRNSGQANTASGLSCSESLNETWRFGVHSTLKLTHRVSLNCGVNLVASDYTRPSSISNSDTSNLTFNATAGIKLLLTNALALTAQYSYTNGSYSGYNYPMPSYNRNVFSFGMNYSF